MHKRINGTVTERLLRRVAIDAESGCWNYLGRLNEGGYGQISVARRQRRSHRICYELFCGPVPEGHELHHTCDNRRCCNPEHLHPTTRWAHMVELTPASPAYQNVRKTHCKRGHAFSPENTRIGPRGWRTCRQCQLDTARAVHERTHPNARVFGPTAGKTHCYYGHPFSDENTKVYRGRRVCIACSRRHGRETYHRKRAREAA